MMSKILTTALAVAIVLLPLGVQSSQPTVKLTDLALPREPTLRDVVALIERNLGAQA